MKKTIIATLFAVLATTNAVAGIDVDEDYSQFKIVGSVQDDKTEDDIFEDMDSNCAAPIPVAQDWSSYLKDNSHIFIGGAVATTAAFAMCFASPHMKGERNCISKNSDRIFKILGIAPKVIEKIVEVEKIVEKEVYVGGGGGGGVEYVEVPVEVQGPTQFVGVQSLSAWYQAMNQAARHYGFKLAAFSADGVSHEKRFGAETWEKLKTMAEGYLNSGDGGVGSLRHGK